MKNLVVLLFILITATGCPIFEHTYTAAGLINNSSQQVRFQISFDYPNIMLPVSENQGGVAFCKAQSSCFLSYKKTNWDRLLSNVRKDTLVFFVVDFDTLTFYGYNKVRENDKILKRYLIHKEDLKKMNYTVTYP
jgi:hypothetical protein